MSQIKPERQPVAWGWLDTIFYLCCIVGFISSVLTARHLTFPLLLVGIVCTALWATVAFLIDRVGGKMRTLLLLLLTLLSAAILVLALFGLGLNWLTAAACVGIATAVVGWFALLVIAGLGLTGILVMVFLGGSLALGDLGSFLISLFFSFALVKVMRQLIEAHKYSQKLTEALKQSHQELIEANEQLQQYAEKVEEWSTMRERNRIAREIHDSVGHSLTLLAVQLETAIKLEERGDPSLRQELYEARRVAGECLADVRRSVAALRPGTKELLADMVRRLVSEFEVVNKGCEVALDLDELTVEPKAEQKGTLYRCAQEALTNISKHSRANKVLLLLRTDEEQAELTVLDNGDGGGIAISSSGFGLQGMRERVEELQGTFRTGAEPGRGWRVEVRLPMHTDQKRRIH
ncbi:signal transduction histidine kinase [Thermosporothrix hazakensis]|uniref:histidine kinase n=2 Tax=Thermosporothrix TaxID=768650 RepID=A0A326UAP5_THEHA|nr:sensor histidine kinase [Thermosporothrix hazakensis]PZW32738.1 signal transduction histidine kinase [Thermosporothrix hazakensis]BBH87653.1 hypothetical protein KTC_24040 [Thermosporothrix sp. COM3]GCE50096.1 hypothetical protein KTH_49650 [Thermosporothrix hazakensis]